MTPSLAVIIPVYNEARQIVESVQTLCGVLPDVASQWEIRVVDDGSEDATVSLVRGAFGTDPRVVVQCEPHTGKGGAVRAGMLATSAALRFMCDADLSMPLSELPRFLALVPGEADVVIGSREGPEARRVGEPAYRHVMGRAFNLVVRQLALPEIQDTQCGFKLFSGAAAEAIFSRTTLDGWAFDLEALVIAQTLGVRVRSLPIEWHHRSESRVSPVGDSIRMFRDVLRVRARAAAGRYRVPIPDAEATGPGGDRPPADQRP